MQFTDEKARQIINNLKTKPHHIEPGEVLQGEELRIVVAEFVRLNASLTDMSEHTAEMRRAFRQLSNTWQPKINL